MTSKWPIHKNKLAVFMLAIFLFFVVGLIAYSIYGHQLLRAMYEGRSLGFLNGIIHGQSFHSLEHYLEVADKEILRVSLSVPFLLIILTGLLRPRPFIICPLGRKWLEIHTDSVDAIPHSLLGLWIALAAGLGLYLELTIIRIHSSYFQLFAYFKNVSLLSCFLGLGIGYARGSTRPLSTPLVLPLLAIQIIFMYIFRFGLLSELLENPISEQLSLGMRSGTVGHILIVYAFLTLIFGFNALCFVPLGHLASRLMMRNQKLISYSWNLIGSLAGILVFSFLSFMWAPPSAWIIVFAIGLMLFLRHHMITFLPSALAVVILLVILARPFRLNQFDVYSPYQILTLNLSADYPASISTSNVYYQKILDLSQEAVMNNDRLEKRRCYYDLPYRFKPKPEDVLIVGSGAGNDVAAAIRNGASEIDAVEIDPAILQFGKELHPESPYQASNVNIHVTDARAFLRHTDKAYDLIVYGLLDSHTLLAGRSGGIRLDSYVYTVEGLREARDKLKADGIVSLTFCLISPQMGRKLFLMLQDAFDGQSPIVYRTGYDGGYTFLCGERLTRATVPLPHVLDEVTARFSDSKMRADKSTDDWPFFYMPVRKYPISYLIIIVVLLAISILFICQLISGSGTGFSIPCFCLGVGFMLVETKGITELALVYGSTWLVISVVITAILVMAFLANLLVMKLGSPRPVMTYGLLSTSLIAGLCATFINLNSLAPWIIRIIMTALLTLPLFFSGFAFSTELRKSVSVAVALSSNLLGAMLGGFLEYNAMYMGFRSLYVIALIAYAFAFFGSVRSRQ